MNIPWRKVLVLGLLHAALAQGNSGPLSVYEIEPNNTPAQAMEVSGTITVMGALQGNDQDGFRWVVSDVDARKRWTLELDGIPGRLTIVDVLRVDYAENGVDVIGVEKLFTIGSRDGSRPGLAENLLFEPGEYILGVAHSGDSGTFRPPAESIGFGEEMARTGQVGDEHPGGYRLHVREGELFNIASNAVDNGSRELASPLAPGRRFGAFVGVPESWFQVAVSENDAGRYWDIFGQIPVGRSGDVALLDAEGVELARRPINRFGKFALRDLGLAEGEYYVQVKEKSGNAIRMLQSSEVGQRAEGREAEPNDRWQLANRFDASETIEGHLAEQSDQDYFVLELGESAADQVSSLRLRTSEGQPVELCLRDDRNQRVQCRQGTGLVELPDLVLPSGDWTVQISRGNDTSYELAFARQGEIESGRETEPNDSIEYSSSVPAENRIKGRLVGTETDFYRFVVTDEAQLWRFQALGDGIRNLRFYDGSGLQQANVTATAGEHRLRMENVFLLPGVHHVSLYGTDVEDYTLLARPLGPPDPNAELEPNDDISRVQPLAIGQTRTGLLPPGDNDNYRFHLADWDHIRLTVAPPPDGRNQVNVFWDTVGFRQTNNAPAGQPVVMEGLFQPGDFRVEIYPLTPSEAEYSIRLERLPRFDCPLDCEPNDNVAFARPLPRGQVVEGRVGEWGDWDWYELPVFEREAGIRITPDERNFIQVLAGPTGPDLVAWNQPEGAYIGTLPPGQEHYLVVRPGGPQSYRFVVAFDDQPPPAPSAGPPSATIKLDLQADAVSAYRAFGQGINGAVTLRNSSTEPLDFDLDAASSDRRWHVRMSSEQVSLAANEVRTVPVEVVVPDDAWAERPVRISVVGRTETGALLEDYRDIRIDRELGAVNPRRHWDLPEALLGGFNVASQSLGGSLVGEDRRRNGWGYTNLFNGYAVDGEGVVIRGGYQGPQQEIVFELAGDQAIEVAGVAVSLLSHRPPHGFIRELDFHASTDGVEFSPVLKRRLDPVKTEQAFVLDAPVRARFGKLMIPDDFTGLQRSGSTLGELKVIARPGFDLSGGQGFNVASPAHGGHLVWSNPQLTWKSLTDETEGGYLSMKRGQPLEFVVGFHHDRAAKISRLEWLHHGDRTRFERFSSVRVSRSMDSPIGPWEPLGEWELGETDGSAAFQFEEPEWVRFLKFSTEPAESAGTYWQPETLRVWEVPTADDYRSILTEWGYGNQAAIYEFQQSLHTEPPEQVSDNTSRDRAAALKPVHPVAGTVRLGAYTNWYRLTVPADQNTLIMALGGESTVRTVVHAEDEAGEAIPTRTNQAESSPSLHIIEAIVEPGSDVYIEISEPPRNVAFLWDTSPSVGPYVPLIYNAMLTYAGDLVPGRDAANFAPYGRDVLLRDWYGEPYILQAILNEYPRQESSSAAEYTMDLASQALGRRAGTKAIINVTDAATGHFPPAWEQFAKVKPRIFNLGVSSAGNLGRQPRAEQDLMQDWSRINGGHYQYMLSQGAMEVAFDRAATLLRRPADYSLSISSEFREAPGPGTLAVVSSEGNEGSTADTRGGVELILDASGSMLKRLDGKRRIAIAREVLAEAVTDTIPAGTPLALRVFGHKEPNTCRTDLEIPLAPLDSRKTVEVISGVNAMNLAKTPIAASLAAAEQDLAGAQGRRVIVLLTDGEETCDGDPEKVIRTLEERGLDISLNIVGFAIDDAALEAQFEAWAKAGNGRYFSAGNQTGLSDAIASALQTPFTVYDRSGNVVAEGVLGGAPVSVDAGFYRVVAATSPVQVFEDVEVPGEEDVIVELRP